MISKELERDLQDALDGKLDARRSAALREVLKSSDELLEAYCDQALLEAAMRNHVSAHQRVPGSIPRRIQFAERVRKRGIKRISILAAAAVLLISGLVLQFFPIAQKGYAQLEISPETILRNSDGTEFSENRIVRGQEIEIVQGVSRLELESGVIAVIDGPAVLSLIGRNKLALAAGHAWFQVPAQANGFQVVCPDLEVTDFGTEFGIDQREGLPANVQVLQGKVKVRALKGMRHELDLTAGHGAELSPSGSWAKIISEPGKFRKELPTALPVLKMSFEGLQGGELAIEGDAIGADSAMAQLINPELAAFVPGISGSALDLRGQGAFIETNWPGISGTAPRTVSLWCRLPAGVRPETAPALAWWGNPAKGWNQKFKFGLVTNKKKRTVLRASFGEIFFSGSTDVADGNWHHLAMVYRGNSASSEPDISFYIDGDPEEILAGSHGDIAVRTDTESALAGTLGIGKYELPANGRNPYLNASIDELQIFAGALNAAEIRKLARAK